MHHQDHPSNRQYNDSPSDWPRNIYESTQMLSIASSEIEEPSLKKIESLEIKCKVSFIQGADRFYLELSQQYAFLRQGGPHGQSRTSKHQDTTRQRAC